MRIRTYASNGSVCAAPDFPGRLEAIQERGGKVVVGDHVRAHVNGVERLGAAVRSVHSRGRRRLGSTASWLVDVVNTLSGNLDRPGGSMFATPVAGGATTRGRPGMGKGFKVGAGTPG
jgi:hypothetical protein